MSKVNKIEFTTKVDDKEVKLCVIRPNARQINEAQKRFAGAFKEFTQAGAILRNNVLSVMKAQNKWTDTQDDKVKELSEKISLNLKKLATKRENPKDVLSRKLKLSELRSIAFEIRRLRNEVQEVMMERNTMEQMSAESQAEQVKFNYLVSVCTVDPDTKKPHFNSVDDYIERGDDQDGVDAAMNFAYLFYKVEKDRDHKLPENKFLLKYNFVREKDLRPVNKQGQLVDLEGNLIDEEGYFVDSKGNRVDKDGLLVDSEGNYVESDDFEDDLKD